MLSFSIAIEGFLGFINLLKTIRRLWTAYIISYWMLIIKLTNTNLLTTLVWSSSNRLLYNPSANLNSPLDSSNIPSEIETLGDLGNLLASLINNSSALS